MCYHLYIFRAGCRHAFDVGTNEPVFQLEQEPEVKPGLLLDQARETAQRLKQKLEAERLKMMEEVEKEGMEAYYASKLIIASNNLPKFKIDFKIVSNDFVFILQMRPHFYPGS